MRFEWTMICEKERPDDYRNREMVQLREGLRLHRTLRRIEGCFRTYLSRRECRHPVTQRGAKGRIRNSARTGRKELGREPKTHRLTCRPRAARMARPLATVGGNSPHGNLVAIQEWQRWGHYLPIRYGNETPVFSPGAGVFCCAAPRRAGIHGTVIKFAYL